MLSPRLLLLTMLCLSLRLSLPFSPASSAHRWALGAAPLASFRSRPLASLPPFAPLPPLASPLSNPNNLDDQLSSFLTSSGSIKLSLCTIRNLLNDQSAQQELSATATQVLGNAHACTLLCAGGMQDVQEFQLTLKCTGPIGGIVSISTGRGEVKGYVGDNEVEGVGPAAAVGGGTVQVVKSHPDWDRPYNGVTAIVSGDVDRDLAAYMATSEQREVALTSAVAMRGLLCVAAGGFLVEKLPGCGGGEMERVEENLRRIGGEGGDAKGALERLLLEGKSPEELAADILEGVEYGKLEEIEPKPTCHCSEGRLFR
jgi:molecular chaperone Hsp33